MKIKEGYVLKEVAGNNIVVNVGGSVDFNGMITLNETGALLWRTLEQNADEKTLVQALLEEYDIDEQTALTDVKRFINKLKDADIVE